MAKTMFLKSNSRNHGGLAGASARQLLLKQVLRALLHQRDMLAYEHASLELFDLIEEVDEEIQELQKQIRKIA